MPSIRKQVLSESDQVKAFKMVEDSGLTKESANALKCMWRKKYNQQVYRKKELNVEITSTLEVVQYLKDRKDYLLKKQIEIINEINLLDKLLLCGECSNLPPFEDKLLSQNNKLPQKVDKLPSRDDKLPQKVDKLPSRDDKLPQKVDKLLSRDDKLPQKVDKLLSRDDKLPQKVDKLPPKEDKLPQKVDKLLSRDDKLPPKEDKLPPKDDKLPQKKDKLPQKKDKLPQKKDKLPVSDDKLPHEERCQYCGKDAEGYDYPCGHPVCYTCHEEKLEVVKVIPGVCTRLESVCGVCGCVEKVVYDDIGQSEETTSSSKPENTC